MSVRQRTAEIRSDESGFSLVMVAMMVTVLVAMAAFAVDFGWLYWNGIKIQHGADAAALSGVVYEPNDQATAYSEARDAAAENGYRTGDPGTTVTPVDYNDDATAVDNANQLRVTVTDTVPTFFMTIFGVENVAITKHAIAEYVLPLAMGSDEPYFGQDPELGNNPNFWANIHGYKAATQWGDRYSAQCVGASTGDGCTVQDYARPTTFDGTRYSGGYVYGIEKVDSAGSLSVEIFDGHFYRGGGDFFLVGDEHKSGGDGPTTVFQLYAPDPTPLDTSDNPVLCTMAFGPRAPDEHYADFDGDGDLGRNAGGGLWNADPDDDMYPVGAPDGYFDWRDIAAYDAANPWDVGSVWESLCGTSFSGNAGIYPLRVVTLDNGEWGLNRYSIRSSTSAGPAPRMYGLGDMSVYVNFATNSATFDLAEVSQVHAGKTLVIDLWDSDSGIGNVSVKKPGGATQACDWSATTGDGATDSDCSIPTGTYNFNNHSMEIRLEIPNTYTCTPGVGAGCWWTIELYYPGGANDTTTWSAHIEGNPVRLVE